MRSIMTASRQNRSRPSLPPPPDLHGSPTWRTEGTPPASPPPKRAPTARWKQVVAVVAVLLIVNLVIGSLLSKGSDRTGITYSRFTEEVLADNVASVTTEGDGITGTFRTPIAVKEGDQATVTEFSSRRPAFADDTVLATLLANGAVVEATTSSGSSAWMTLLVSFGPILLLVGVYVWFMRRMGRGITGIGGLGRSKAVRYDASQRRTTFADVAGIDEATAELVEVVDFLRSPGRYRALGARTPRGVLLVGPPGTGKTLLARAVAGEAQVPFFSMSASEFIEMIVGVGASRVRDLFAQAKAVAPAIVFIDELDAIGRARGATASFGGVDEREQTLNQILTEMDGFTGNEGVIVLAATNRPEILDPALLRAGRFDRRISVNAPDQAGRAAILAVHTRDVPLAADTSLDAIASTTPGMVGADLANLVNEAALLAAHRNHKAVEPADFSDALERILLGAERRILLSDEDRRRTAYHESGHALLGMLQPGADPVRKVSIIPRGRSLGVTFQSPVSDRYAVGEAYLRGRIIGALGGRVAEQLVFGEVTTGAESDLEQVASLARQMVGRWGMSAAIGPMSVMPPAGEEATMFGLDGRGPSEATRRLVDREARAIVEECAGKARSILESHRNQLDDLAGALLAHETLDEAAAYAAAGVEPPATNPRVS